MITTSKIKTVAQCKLHQSSGNYYHNLEMENGDKINIGKKKQQQVGWELTYEIIDEGQEYNKAKAAQKVETINPVSNTGSDFKKFERDPSIQRQIVAQSCISSAVAFLKETGPVEEADILALADKFFNYVIKKGVENGSN